MHKKLITFGMLVCLLALSFGFSGCETDSGSDSDSGSDGFPSDLQGTWTDGSYTVVITATTAKVTGTSTAGTGNGIVYELSSTDDSAPGMTKYYFGEGKVNGISTTAIGLAQISGFGLTGIGVSGISFIQQE